MDRLIIKYRLLDRTFCHKDDKDVHQIRENYDYKNLESVLPGLSSTTGIFGSSSGETVGEFAFTSLSDPDRIPRGGLVISTEGGGVSQVLSGPASRSDSENVIKGGEVAGVDTRSKLSWNQ